MSEDRRQRVQATARAAGRAVAAIHRDGRRRVLSAFAAAEPAAITGTSAAAPGATGNASNKHAVRSSAARKSRGCVKAQRLAQRSVREHCARGPVGGLSGAKRRKEAKSAAGSIGQDRSKTLINNDFYRSTPWRTVVPHGAHNPKVASSNLAPATKKYRCLPAPTVVSDMSCLLRTGCAGQTQRELAHISSTGQRKRQSFGLPFLFLFLALTSCGQRGPVVSGIFGRNGQRCQKRPSTNTATLSRPKTKSGRTTRRVLPSR